LFQIGFGFLLTKCLCVWESGRKGMMGGGGGVKKGWKVCEKEGEKEKYKKGEETSSKHHK